MLITIFDYPLLCTNYLINIIFYKSTWIYYTIDNEFWNNQKYNQYQSQSNAIVRQCI